MRRFGGRGPHGTGSENELPGWALGGWRAWRGGVLGPPVLQHCATAPEDGAPSGGWEVEGEGGGALVGMEDGERGVGGGEGGQGGHGERGSMWGGEGFGARWLGTKGLS